MTTATAFPARVDVRTIAPRERHPLIFRTFGELPVGAAMELVNDHDPLPLYDQFAGQRPGEFDWQYVESGPDVWRVAISRVARAGEAAGGCGGCGCGGAH